MNHSKKAIVIALVLTGIMTTAFSLGACGSTAKSASSSDTETGSVVSDADQSVVDTDVTEDNVASFINLGEYKNLDITLNESTDSSSTDSTATGDTAILSNSAQYTMNLSEDTVIQKGITANIDYVGKIDGKEFDGGSSTGYNLNVGSGTFISGFEDQLIGHKKGDKVAVNVTFPTTYQDTSVSGKDAVFDVTINYVTESPWQYVSDNSKVLQYPKNIIDTWSAQIDSTYSYYAFAYSMTVDAYKEAANITTTTEQTAKEQTKKYLLSEAIMKDSGVTEDSDLYKNLRAEILTSSGYSTESDAAAAGINDTQIDISTKYYVAYALIVKNAKVKVVASSTATTASTASAAG